MIRWTVPLRQKLVVVDIDTQRCFFPDNGNAHIHNNETVLANIRRVIAWTRLKHICVVSTKQVPVCYCDFQRGNTNGLEKIGWTLRNRRTQFDATDSTDLPIEILKQYDQVIFCKRCVDPFEEPRADRILTESEADEFILIGAPTEGAVRTTALGLLHRQKKVTVLVNATGSLNVASGKRALRHMRARGARLINTKVFLKHFSLHLARA